MCSLFRWLFGPVLISTFALVGALGLPTAAFADSTAGVCPDGSMFIVADRRDAPCARAKFVEPSELPPIKPEYLPRPYTWYVDREIQDDKNPYNLLDAAQRMRELRSGSAPGRTPAPDTTPQPRSATAGGQQPLRAPSGASVPRPGPLGPANAPSVELGPDELRDLVQVVALRQEVTPATLSVEDAAGRQALVIHYAHSAAFEDQVLRQLGRTGEKLSVIAFSARALRDTAFAANFQVSQESRIFRPGREDPRELGFVLGAPGALARNTLVLGYLVVPARFDLAAPLALWWNDRRIDATLK